MHIVAMGDNKGSLLVPCSPIPCLKQLKERKFLEPSQVPQWAVSMALRVSAACRHFSQAVLRQRKWLPEIWIDQKSKTRKSRKTDAPEFEAAPLETSKDDDPDTEPEDDMKEEIDEWIQKANTLAWQSSFLAYIQHAFDDPDTFLFSPHDDDDPLPDTEGTMQLSSWVAR